MGLVTAVVATHLVIGASGAEVVTPWAGAGLSLYWLGLSGAAVIAVDAIAPAGVLTGVAVLLATGIAVGPLLVAPAIGTSAVAPGTARLLPALVQARADADPGIGTLVLTAQRDGSLAARIERDGGTTLDETSTLVSTRPTLRDEDRELAELAGNLASLSGFDPTAMLQKLRIAFIVVPESTGEPTGLQAAVRQRTTEALDATPVLAATGRTPLWEYSGLDPAEPTDTPEPSTLSRAVPIAQGAIFAMALLLAIPSTRRRRAVRELGPLESDPADTFDEDDDG